MDPFIRRFGDLGPSGKYTLPATFLSYSNAFPFILLVFGKPYVSHHRSPGCQESRLAASCPLVTVAE
jgi:hypothetical protein